MTSVLNVDEIAAKDGTSPVELTKQAAAKQFMYVADTTINESLNTSSISDAGDYFDVNYTNSFSDANYSVVTGGSQSGYTTDKGTSIGVASLAASSRDEFAMTEAHAGYATGSFDFHCSTTFGDLA